MKILTVHNKYKSRGGEDESRESEDQLLSTRGHEVRELVFDNTVIRTQRDAIRAGLQASWAPDSYRQVKAAVAEWKPDIIDIHNFFPLASPAVHYAARSVGVPVVQTLHNFRLLCPGATFFRDGHVCEECVRFALPWPGIVHGCYQSSSLKSAAVAAMIASHRLLKTWDRRVSVYVAVSQFTKQKFVENGFKEDKILVKPNFVSDTGRVDCAGSDLLFVGRLASEKGIGTLIRAMDAPSLGCLDIIGDGPLSQEVRAAASRNPRIRYRGAQGRSEVLSMMGKSQFLIVPSECNETFGRVAVEAFSRGTPVIASRIGALQEVVSEGRTGFHFNPGDSGDLSRVISEVAANSAKIAMMRIECRKEYEEKYTPERNYEMLMAIYEKALGTHE